MRDRGGSKLEEYIYPLSYLNDHIAERKVIKEIEDYFEEGKGTEHEYEVCSFFGCGKKLRLEETLAGGRCNKHSGK